MAKGKPDKQGKQSERRKTRAGKKMGRSQKKRGTSDFLTKDMGELPALGDVGPVDFRKAVASRSLGKSGPDIDIDVGEVELSPTEMLRGPGGHGPDIDPGEITMSPTEMLRGPDIAVDESKMSPAELIGMLRGTEPYGPDIDPGEIAMSPTEMLRGPNIDAGDIAMSPEEMLTGRYSPVVEPGEIEMTPEEMLRGPRRRVARRALAKRRGQG